MLPDRSKPYTDASVPVLREHGLTITQIFYRNMFASHPELTNVFNMGSQANRSQQQSLASAVSAYVANHSNGAALASAVNCIVHKCAAMGIKPNHYPTVAHHLLGVITGVLGDTVTPDLLAAWDEAYQPLVAELTVAEAYLYQHTGGGPDHRQPVRIANRRQQAEDVVSFMPEAVGDAPSADFLPGQHILVQVELVPDALQQRQYSLSDAPNGRMQRIPVKRDAGDADRPVGTVPSRLRANTHEGDVLLVSQPYGDFVPQLTTSNPIVLMSAGVGITPMVSALNTLAQQNSACKIVFSHTSHAVSHVAHIDDLRHAAQALPAFEAHALLESGEDAEFAQRPAHPSRVMVDMFVRDHGTETDFYLCDPLPFMQAQRAVLLVSGISSERIHREVFGPDPLDDIL